MDLNAIVEMDVMDTVTEVMGSPEVARATTRAQHRLADEPGLSQRDLVRGFLANGQKDAHSRAEVLALLGALVACDETNTSGLRELMVDQLWASTFDARRFVSEAGYRSAALHGTVAVPALPYDRGLRVRAMALAAWAVALMN